MMKIQIRIQIEKKMEIQKKKIVALVHFMEGILVQANSEYSFIGRTCESLCKENDRLASLTQWGVIEIPGKQIEI